MKDHSQGTKKQMNTIWQRRGRGERGRTATVSVGFEVDGRRRKCCPLSAGRRGEVGNKSTVNATRL